MVTSASIQVGNYTYSAEDARNTIAALGNLWSEHRHDSDIPEGWLSGARGFLAEIAGGLGLAMPDLVDLDRGFTDLTADVMAAYSRLDPMAVADVLETMWRFFPTMRVLDHEHHGTIASLHAGRGLPKPAVASAHVDWGGMAGDIQRSRKHHGRPWQALCIWSSDAISQLQSLGHPIEPGFAGENICVAGIPATAFRPGAQFVAGSVRGFLTSYTWPCSQNAGWFAERDFMAMAHTRGNLSRLYAMVTTPGDLTPGDSFTLFTDR